MTKKEKVKSYKVIISILIFAVLILGIFLITKISNNETGNVISSTNSPSQSSSTLTQNNPPTTNKNCHDVQVPYTANVCNPQNLEYSVTNAHWTPYQCNKQSKYCTGSFLGIATNCTNFCADQTLTYSIDVNNLDSQSGTFTFNINFYSPDKTLYKTIPLTQSLYPQTTQSFIGTFEITSDSPTGDANKMYSATYQEVSIPTKQVCQYVTNYRTETQCN